MAPIIRIDKVSKVYAARGHETVALSEVSLEVDEGEFVVFLGPSGCGKSTLLRMIAGLTAQSDGQMSIAGRQIVGHDPAVGMVFQSYTSFPWLSVAGNVGFGLELRGKPAAERKTRVAEMLERVGLTKFAGAYPSQLSGGMQQRVAIARALAMEPRILLMDEPFGALDAMTRVEMQEFLTDLWAQLRTTVVFVTHDIDEAILLADRIVVLHPHPGRIAEIVTNTLPRPRRYIQADEPDFAALRHRLRELIFGMVR